MNGAVGALVPLLLRTRSFRAAMVPLLVAALLGWTAYLSLEARHLSPDQKVTAALGGSDGATTVPALLDPGQAGPDLPVTFRGVHVDAVRILSVIDLETPTGQQGFTYQEQPLPNASIEGVLELREGRWPARPGEVVVSAASGLRVGDRLSAVHGKLNLTPVGVVSPVWERTAPLVVAAPGTWARWKVTPQEAQESGLQGYREVFWSSSDPAGAVTRLDRHVESGELDPSHTAAEVRAQATAFSGRAWLERRLPAVLAVWMGALATGGLLLRAVRRTTLPLRRVGLPTRDLHRATVLAAGLATGVVLVVAWLGALAATAVVRTTVLADGDAPLPPFRWWGPPLWIGALTAAFVVLVLAALPVEQRRRRSRRRALSARVMAVAGAALCALALVGTLQGKGFTGILLVLAASCLGTALLAGAALGLVRATGPVGSGLLARRLVARQAVGLTSLVVVVALLSGVVGSTFAVAAGLITHLNASSSTGMPPGMAAIRPLEPGERPPEDLAGQFRQDLGLGEPVTVWYGFTPGEEGREVPWWAVAQVADAERLFGDLTPDQEKALASRAGLPVVTDASDAHGPVLVVGQNLKWLQAVKLGEPKSSADTEVLWVHSGLTPEQDRQAAHWAEDHGRSPYAVWATHVADPIPIATGVQLAAGAFTLLTMLVCGLGMRGLVRSLMPLLAGLRASGLGARWLRAAVLQVALLVGCVAAAGGLAGVLLSVAGANPLVNHTISLGSLPWLALGLVAVGGPLGAVLGGLLASRRVRVQERRA